MGFTLYNEATGTQYHYVRDIVVFGRNDLEKSLLEAGGTVSDDVKDSLECVSRRHIRVMKRGGSYEVHNLSKNGTCVNGERIMGSVSALRSGDLIRLGSEDMDTAFAVYFLHNGDAQGFIQNRVSGTAETDDLSPFRGG